MPGFLLTCVVLSKYVVVLLGGLFLALYWVVVDGCHGRSWLNLLVWSLCMVRAVVLVYDCCRYFWNFLVFRGGDGLGIFGGCL